MKIELKFDIDQDVYYLENNKIVKGIIDGAEIELNSKNFSTVEMSIRYRVRVDNSYSYFAEESIFSDMEDLCASLIESARDRYL